MDSEDSAVYLFFRPLIKFILHKLTGQTEVERVSRNQDVVGLDKSITLSKTLVGYRQRHCHWNEKYQADQCEELCAIKHIEGQDRKFRVGVALQTLHSWKYAIGEVERVRKTQYNRESARHEEMLMEVWNCLRPNRAIKARKSTEWIELGFQADDPATDFRGAGLLGLINLHGWVKKQEGKAAFAVADQQGTDYFFASASLYLTMLALQLMKQLYVPANYWVVQDRNSILNLFQMLFQSIWSEFVQFWNTVQDKSLMQFNMNLQSFAQEVKSIRSPSVVGRLNKAQK